jgi:hypothetical protein
VSLSGIDGTSTEDISLTLLDANGTAFADNRVQLNGNSGWQYYTSVFVAVSDRTQLRFRDDGVVNSLGGFIDDVSVFETSDTPYFLVDLDVDSNNDGAIDPDNSADGTDDPIEDDSGRLGASVLINYDDDDDSGTMDRNEVPLGINVSENPAVPGLENDLVARPN